MAIHFISKEKFIEAVNNRFTNNYKPDILFGDVFEDRKKIQKIFDRFKLLKDEKLHNLDIDTTTIDLLKINDDNYYARISDTNNRVYIYVD